MAIPLMEGQQSYCNFIFITQVYLTSYSHLVVLIPFTEKDHDFATATSMEKPCLKHCHCKWDGRCINLNLLDRPFTVYHEHFLTQIQTFPAPDVPSNSQRSSTSLSEKEVSIATHLCRWVTQTLHFSDCTPFAPTPESPCQSFPHPHSC